MRLDFHRFHSGDNAAGPHSKVWLLSSKADLNAPFLISNHCQCLNSTRISQLGHSLSPSHNCSQANSSGPDCHQPDMICLLRLSPACARQSSHYHLPLPPQHLPQPAAGRQAASLPGSISGIIFPQVHLALLSKKRGTQLQLGRTTALQLTSSAMVQKAQPSCKTCFLSFRLWSKQHLEVAADTC